MLCTYVFSLIIQTTQLNIWRVSNSGQYVKHWWKIILDIRDHINGNYTDASWSFFGVFSPRSTKN